MIRGRAGGRWGGGGGGGGGGAMGILIIYDVSHALR